MRAQLTWKQKKNGRKTSRRQGHDEARRGDGRARWGTRRRGTRQQDEVRQGRARRRKGEARPSSRVFESWIWISDLGFWFWFFFFFETESITIVFLLVWVQTAKPQNSLQQTIRTFGVIQRPEKEVCERYYATISCGKREY